MATAASGTNHDPNGPPAFKIVKQAVIQCLRDNIISKQLGHPFDLDGQAGAHVGLELSDRLTALAAELDESRDVSTRLVSSLEVHQDVETVAANLGPEVDSLFDDLFTVLFLLSVWLCATSNQGKNALSLQGLTKPSKKNLQRIASLLSADRQKLIAAIDTIYGQDSHHLKDLQNLAGWMTQTIHQELSPKDADGRPLKRAKLSSSQPDLLGLLLKVLDVLKVYVPELGSERKSKTTARNKNGILGMLARSSGAFKRLAGRITGRLKEDDFVAKVHAQVDDFLSWPEWPLELIPSLPSFSSNGAELRCPLT
ncbi:uncharacterized protein MONBRDRAFT_36877 [Monosiga brevicollis MX1]|uniref:Uncharacterized protein n=1 Tax=Monosiga brevicollis TaxID=81824 RepID=A9UXH0_MONBE|nr:uncharacterized protein MONBRDRAFT_36877 [Monosiga brevicollis MX1]EDQ90005.1 predicted protein [Monosiga brevicollis MX1]|eukprot:XP_001745427.1 hypothetical protein [Monosiga brevicollis MX1]